MPELIEYVSAEGGVLNAHASRCTAPHASAIVLPALGVAPRHYAALTDALARCQIESYCLEPRAHAKGLAVHDGYARRARDAAAALAALTPDTRPRIVIGHSIGAHVAALLAAREPQLVDRLVFVAAGTPNVRRFPLVMRLKIHVLRLVAALSPVLGYFPGRSLGFGNRESPTLMREWARLAGSGEFVVDGQDVASELAQVSAPLLSIQVSGDEMAPAAATQDLLARLPRARRSSVTLGASELPPEARDHVRWLRHPNSAVERIVEFLDTP